MRSKLIGALTLSAALAAPAFAGNALAAPDQTLGMAIMSAAVSADGTLLRGAGVMAVTKSSVPGRYEISFIRKVDSCEAVATAQGQVALPRAVQLLGVVDDTIYFQTGSENDGEPTNSDFYVIVFCAR
jgi:hypothetical protein